MIEVIEEDREAPALRHRSSSQLQASKATPLRLP